MNTVWPIKFAVLIFGASIVLANSSCGARQHLEVANTLDRLREIRTAEEIYFNIGNRGRYGSLRELADDGLIKDTLADGEDYGYNFDLRANGASYAVNANPLMEGSEMKMGNCFFMDRSGVIRASNKDNVPADEFSYPIGNQ